MSVRIGIATQTPLLRLPGPGNGGNGHAELHPLRRAWAGLRRATVLQPPEPEPVTLLADSSINPGGVSRMVLESVRAWRGAGWVGEAHWFCLQPRGVPRVHLQDEGIDLHNLRLSTDELAAYARTKERLWASLHGLPAERFGQEDFRFYARYNALAADAILELAPDLDAAYVHDFQLLQVGAMVGLAAPCVLRWHVPFDPVRIPAYTRSFLLRMMEAFDGVLVSTRRELEGLTNAGYHGRIHQLYPHSDASTWTAAGRADEEELETRLGLPKDAPVVLCVARMDPIKRQDLLLQALARSKTPQAHLVLVGNGSFSGQRGGGLGLSKSAAWRARLEREAQELGIARRVRFTGWMPDRLVSAAYRRADVLVLPSDLEGFGLTPFEAWANGKPCVVTSGCGCAEVVQDGLNGLVVPPGDAPALAAALDRILSDRGGAERMGEAGRIALAAHGAARAAQRERAFIEDAMARYGA